VAIGLPEGFELDQPQDGQALPAGFQLDQPQTVAQQPVQQLQNAPQNAIPSNQVAPPIDLKGAIQERLKQRKDGGLSQDVAVARSAAGGINSMMAGLAGLPMDTVQNIINLGISAYGASKVALGGDPSEQPRADYGMDTGGLVGGSQDIKRRIGSATGMEFFKPSDETPLQQNVHMGASIMGGGALAPATGMKQVASNVAKMAVPAVSAVAAKEAFPNQPLAPMAAMLASGVVKPAVQAARASAMKPNASFLKARKLGYKLPPVSAKPTKTQQGLQGASGNVPIKQQASVYNQKITNNIIKKDLGYSKDVPLSSEGLNAVRIKAGKVYEKVSNIGQVKVDKAFTKDLTNISSKGSVLAKEIPGLAKKNVDKLVAKFDRGEYSSGALVEAIKQLRADSKTGFKSQDPSMVSMAKAQGKIANAIESLMERSLSKTNPNLLPEFKAARQRIAKTYTIENALKGENVDAVALGRMLDKGKPMSGAIKKVAEVGQNFKGSVQTNVPQDTGFRPGDALPGVVTAISTGNPLWLIGMAARPAARHIMLSKPYQSKLAKVYPKQIKDIQKLPAESQVIAINSLLEQIRTQDKQQKQSSK